MEMAHLKQLKERQEAAARLARAHSQSTGAMAEEIKKHHAEVEELKQELQLVRDTLDAEHTVVKDLLKADIP